MDEKISLTLPTNIKSINITYDMYLFLRIIRKITNSLIFSQFGLNKGNNVDIRHCVYFDKPEKIHIGNNTLINYGCNFHIGCSNETIIIGNNVQIGMNCSFSCVSHTIGDNNQRAGKHTYKSIKIEDGCWLGANCTILQGVTIAKGCIIAAGAVVIKSTLPNGLYAGVPAKRIKEL